MISIVGTIVIPQFFATGGVSASGSCSLVFKNAICHTHPPGTKGWYHNDLRYALIPPFYFSEVSQRAQASHS
jgi:hypothetical protein